MCNEDCMAIVQEGKGIVVFTRELAREPRVTQQIFAEDVPCVWSTKSSRVWIVRRFRTPDIGLKSRRFLKVVPKNATKSVSDFLELLYFGDRLLWYEYCLYANALPRRG